jgi:hypothetical protein
MEHGFNTQNVYSEAQFSLHIRLFLPLSFDEPLGLFKIPVCSYNHNKHSKN